MTRLSIVATLMLFVISLVAGVNLAAMERKEPLIEAYFIAPSDGKTVRGPIQIIFGLKGMGVAPAGVEKAGTGHHHVLIDRAPLKGDELLDPLPSDEHHRHFGGGQTETVIDLAPGVHTLQLVLGDHNHIPHDPPVMSNIITITVE